MTQDILKDSITSSCLLSFSASGVSLRFGGIGIGLRWLDKYSGQAFWSQEKLDRCVASEESTITIAVDP